MERPVVELEGLEGLEEVTACLKPVRLVFSSPRRGGPSVSAIRSTLASKGRLRISGTGARISVDLDPGDPEPPLVALDTIVRSDAAGLERMLLSVLPYVDEIVLGVDARSDAETREVAEAYADTVIVFDAAMIGLPDEDWAAGKIHFANARNLGRARLKSEWSLVIDSDEYLKTPVDFRALAVKDSAVGSYGVDVQLPGFKMKQDLQRFARARYRWSEGIHNQLLHGDLFERCDAIIVSDLTLRQVTEIARRHAQRDLCIEDLAEEASKGNIVALFHLTKHRSAKGDINVAAKMAEDYRLRIEPHSILFNERIWIALGVAFRYYHEDNFDEAERWAVRALLDGPNTTAFCLLGDIAEDQGDLPRALGWYEAACALTTEEKMAWPGFSDLRFGRLSGIRMAIKDPLTAPMAEITEGPLEEVAGA